MSTYEQIEAIHRENDVLKQQLAAIKSALPDDFSEAKDWTFSNEPVARIEWLKAMYLNRKRDSEEAFEQLAACQADKEKFEVVVLQIRKALTGSIHSEDNILDVAERMVKKLATSESDRLRLRELIPKRIPNGFVSFGKYYTEQENIFADPYNKMGLFKKKYLASCDKALDAPTGDLSALREVMAQVLEEIDLKRDAKAIRSGEWTPEVLK